MNSVRINKALAHAGVCSRRKADEYILNGAVTVNGKCITTPGIYVQPKKDCIMLYGKPISIQQHIKKNCYLLMYKPIQVISTVYDPQQRTTVLHFIPEPWKNYRLYPVGRLDFFSEGLLIITNDGELTHRLTHPRYHVSKVYHVQIREHVSPALLETLRQGGEISKEKQLPPVKVQVLSKTNKTSTWLEFTLQQGINRQIRRICQNLGLTILKLIRVKQGNITLGGMSPGMVRTLTSHEVQVLKKLIQIDNKYSSMNLT